MAVTVGANLLRKIRNGGEIGMVFRASTGNAVGGWPNGGWANEAEAVADIKTWPDSDDFVACTFDRKGMPTRNVWPG